MRGEILLADMASIHMRVYLRCGDIAVSEHFLKNTQIRPAFEHVSGETVPERMGMQAFDTHLMPIAFDNLADAAARDSPAPRVEKDSVWILRAGFGAQMRPSFDKIVGESRSSGPHYRHETIFAALAMDPDEPLFRKQASKIETDEL